MRLWVDTDACEGHGRCYEIAPDTFDSDERGHSRVIHELVPDHELEAARAAVNACPEQAIHLDEP